ncbi:hypothetical protein JCM10450v2_001617 [Rhodotorula kratochvilovae]
MQQPTYTEANAQQNANIAVRDVLVPLIQSGLKQVYLGGVASLAVFARSARERGHPLSIEPLLQTVLLPFKFAPLIVHLPSKVSEVQAEKEQRDFAEGADHGKCARNLQNPFNTSLFLQPLPSSRGGEVDYLVHLRFVSLPIDPHAFDRLVHSVPFNRHAVHHLSWPALVAEQLLLGADTSQVAGIEASFMIIRWATLAGRDEIKAARAAREAGRAAARPPFESVTLGLAEAIKGMLWSEEGDAVMDHTSMPDLLAQYVNIKDTLKHILEDAQANHPRRKEERSLAKSAFAPASRKRGERMAVFA